MTSTQTPTPAQPVTTCPPSDVRDQIVRWDKVKAGDLVLWKGDFAVAQERDDSYGDPAFLIGGRWVWPPHTDLVAVRRYTEGLVTITARTAQLAASALDENADDRSDRAGTACRDCAEAPGRYCEGCQDLLDTAGEYRELRDELIKAAGNAPAAPASPRFHVGPALPGLPAVPADISPVKCLGCEERTATIRHDCAGPGGALTATMICDGCGSVFDLLASNEGYLAGLEAGVIVEAARRGDPRVARS